MITLALRNVGCVYDKDDKCVGKFLVNSIFSVHNDFNRFGQYDFTKKDEGKIEPLYKKYTESFLIGKATNTGDAAKWRNIDIGAVGEKINELVEAVNRLEEKVNGLA